MAFAASYQIERDVEQSRQPSRCRVHACVRCAAAIQSDAPCSFVKSVVSVCRACFGQEQVLRHLPVSRTWGAGLARAHRA
jgi:hypothetical protein